ncbi:MAG: preprotein translocase subunit YajC [Thalassobium sp.]|uniref:Sec translocon accessory complex subunit YajC n=1 Tax=Thalassolituus pacificus TaxID=2975440 RepID=A0A9X2WBZ1_9GAMM|nr:preprotein translocase subunit YajC [Thalassolituus pacificus]MCT7357652.1 preprotein translocase subunit YajC [Thalassolituus pacificus]PHS61887.1 MAG: preprotein translocase subunit YajC [Thalassobium sp.]
MKAILAALALTTSGLAMADGAAAAQQPMGITGQLVFLGGFLLIFYFLLWRPQSKRQKEHKNLIGGLSKGDEVVTAGGMLGKITKVTDDFVVIEVADGVQLPVQKVAITAALPKGTIKDVKA